MNEKCIHANGSGGSRNGNGVDGDAFWEEAYAKIDDGVNPPVTLSGNRLPYKQEEIEHISNIVPTVLLPSTSKVISPAQKTRETFELSLSPLPPAMHSLIRFHFKKLCNLQGHILTTATNLARFDKADFVPSSCRLNVEVTAHTLTLEKYRTECDAITAKMTKAVDEFQRTATLLIKDVQTINLKAFHEEFLRTFCEAAYDLSAIYVKQYSPRTISREQEALFTEALLSISLQAHANSFQLLKIYNLDKTNPAAGLFTILEHQYPDTLKNLAEWKVLDADAADPDAITSATANTKSQDDTPLIQLTQPPKKDHVSTCFANEHSSQFALEFVYPTLLQPFLAGHTQLNHNRRITRVKTFVAECIGARTNSTNKAVDSGTGIDSLDPKKLQETIDSRVDLALKQLAKTKAKNTSKKGASQSQCSNKKSSQQKQNKNRTPSTTNKAATSKSRRRDARFHKRLQKVAGQNGK